jgi:hypothetical protein
MAEGITTKFYTAEECLRKEDQHWEMAGLARADNDPVDAAKHYVKARLWASRKADGGFQT